MPDLPHFQKQQASQFQARNAPAQSLAKPHPSTAATPPSRTIAPGVERSELQAAPSQNLGIKPTALPNNDSSLACEWRPVDLGLNRSCGCTITTTAGHALTVTIEQPPYQRTLQGTGPVVAAAIPVAPLGTEGRLIARDDTTGAIAEFIWRWQPLGTVGWAAPSKRTLKSLASKFWAKIAPASRAKQANSAQRTKTVSCGKATTAFCGQQATGQRFAFILDMSGSMEGARWATCTRELKSALDGLAGIRLDNASFVLENQAEFFVILFSSGVTEPPGQAGWTNVDQSGIAEVMAWVATIHPSGGTYPGPAFERVFSLSSPPDVVYFLTDGELFGFSPPDCARLRLAATSSDSASGLGKLFSFGDDSPSTVINTISLDSDESASVLQEIAAESGGQYVHVSSTALS